MLKILNWPGKCYGLGLVIFILTVFYGLEMSVVSVAVKAQKPKPLLISQGTVQQERRVALVIGNGSYTEGKLNNPTNDAADMAKVLRKLKFEVTLVENVNKQQMDAALGQFYKQLRLGGVGLFYYAGHGVQVEGENYLIPIGARLSQKSAVPYEAVPLGRVFKAMEEEGNGINIVLIDACRNDPYSQSWSRSEPLLRGLAPFQAGRGTFISFATAPGKVAADGSGRNSPYTTGLLQHIQIPGLPIEQMFKKVRETVDKITNQGQVPWESSSMIGDFAFSPIGSNPAQVPPIQKPETVVPKPSSPVVPKPSSPVVPKPSSPVVPKPSSPVVPKPSSPVVPKPSSPVVSKPFSSPNQAQLLYSLSGHKGAVNSVVFTPFNQQAISGSADKTIRVWDLKTGQTSQTLTSTNVISKIALSADGKTVHGTGPSLAPNVKSWRRENGQLQRVITDFDSVVRSIDVNPSNGLLATGLLDGQIKIWDNETGKLLRILKGHTDAVSSVAFSPDSRFLVSSGVRSDRTVRVWDATTGEMLRTLLGGHQDWVLSVAVSPNGRYIASSSADKTIKLWDFESGLLLKTFTGHTNWVRSVAFSRNNNRIVSGSKDGTVKVWDVDSGALRYDLSGKTKAIDEVQSVAFASDNQTIMAGSTDQIVRIWRLED
jgi:WD40 repeat protein